MRHPLKMAAAEQPRTACAAGQARTAGAAAGAAAKAKTDRPGRAMRPGVITVFFTLLTVVFLGLMFMLLESVRVAAARAQTAHITQMASMSVFGEYERELLGRFEIFAVDGAYGSASFSAGKVRERLNSYLSVNARPLSGNLEGAGFDPWQVSLSDVSVTAYALLTDRGGEYFYQQAVSYMRQTAVTGIGSRLLTWYKQAQTADRAREEYEEKKETSDHGVEALEQAQQERAQEIPDSEENGAGSEVPGPCGGGLQATDPLPAIRRLASRDLLSITCGEADISDQSVSRSQLCSKRSRCSGTMVQETPCGGLMDDLYFREYLLGKFGDFREPSEGALSYELEYILCGKRSDRANLKSCIRRMLALREGCNYLYLAGSETMAAQAGALAYVLTGWTGIPALTGVMKQALLLAWAYGESLLDVRALTGGGSVPLFKSEETWTLTLENLHRLDELIDAGGSRSRGGLTYRGHLRILLYLQSVNTQKMRALDMVELRICRTQGLENFRADHCVIGLRMQSTWQIRPLFSRVSAVLLEVSGQDLTLSVDGGYAYH